jgi:hypothetical protein
MLSGAGAKVRLVTSGEVKAIKFLIKMVGTKRGIRFVVEKGHPVKKWP